MGTVGTVSIGGVDYDVYALMAAPVQDLVDYWAGRLGAQADAVAAASADNRAKSLVGASDMIDRVSRFSGTKTSSSQPRSWPRDSATCDGEAITDGTTPDAVANATFALAGILLVDATVALSAGQGSNVKRAKAGSAEVQFFSSTIGTGRDTRLPPIVHDYLRCLLAGSGGAAAGAAYGSDPSNESAFCETDYTRTHGFS